MDPEEIWRQAMLEADAGGGSSTTAATAKPDAQRNTYDDDFDDEFDAELLQSVPCAFDAAPEESAVTMIPFSGINVNITAHHPVISSGKPTVSTTGSGSAPASSVPATTTPTPEGAEREVGLVVARRTEPCGVYKLPPPHCASIMLRGDGGSTRWVTVTSGQRHPEGRPFTGLRDDSSDSENDEGSLHPGTHPIGTAGHRAGTTAHPHRRGRGTGLLGPDSNIADLLAKIHAEKVAEEERQAREARMRAIDEEFGLDALEGPEVEHDGGSGLGGGGGGGGIIKRRPHLTNGNSDTSSQHLSTNADANRSGGELWVTKYTPRSFREVLSDEAINLELLRWLKSWDAYVFGTASAPSSATRQHATAPARGNASAGVAEEAPQPPEERMAILTGPPGVGKTTLVHVLAAHCGYEVIEINASVERTYSRLEAVIKTAVSAASGGGRSHAPPMPSTMGATRRAHRSEEGAPATRSLVDHLRTPKCLVIDEMDGIQSNVAHLLLSLDIHRPVFCMCNDLYVPALRPLRASVHFIHHLPAIRPQRLLSRLEEICLKEGLPIDKTALADLVRTSNGDVRSCLNSLQFLHRGLLSLTQTNHQGGAAALQGSGTSPVTASAAVMEMFRRMQSKDRARDIWQSWDTVFSRADRAKSIQLLKKECNYDYERVVGAASVSGRRYQAAQEMRRKRAREGVVDRVGARDAAYENDRHLRDGADELAEEGGGRHEASAIEDALSADSPVLGFRVDPAYIYASHQLGGGGAGIAGSGDATGSSATAASATDVTGSAGRTFLNGLQENYLRRPYTDYAFAQTERAADGFAFQNILTAQAFSTSGHSGGSGSSLIDFAEKYEAITALRTFASCSSSARGERIAYPREDATARQQLVEAHNITREFRDACSASQTYPFLWCDENVSGEFCPMLLRSLFDANIKFPLRPLSDLSALPAADQALMRASVERHAAYGLSYRKVFLTSLPPHQQQRLRQLAKASGHGGGMSQPQHNNFFAQRGSDDGSERTELWLLSPAIDQLGGVAGPVISGSGGGSGGFRSSGSARAMGLLGPSSSAAANAKTATSTPQAPLIRVKDEIKELMVGEIRRYAILARAQSHTTGKQAASSSAAVTNEEEAPLAKKQRTQEKETISPTAAATAEAVVRPTLPEPTNTGEKAPASTTTAATAAPPIGTGSPPPAPVRRDFFWRVIPATPTNATSDKATKKNHVPRNGSSPSPAATPTAPNATAQRKAQQQQQPLVKYVYQDGSTNAVKMPAALSDF